MSDSSSPKMRSSKTLIRMPIWVFDGNSCEILGMAGYSADDMGLVVGSLD